MNDSIPSEVCSILAHVKGRTLAMLKSSLRDGTFSWHDCFFFAQIVNNLRELGLPVEFECYNESFLALSLDVVVTAEHTVKVAAHQNYQN